MAVNESASAKLNKFTNPCAVSTSKTAFNPRAVNQSSILTEDADNATACLVLIIQPSSTPFSHLKKTVFPIAMCRKHRIIFGTDALVLVALDSLVHG